MRAYVRIDPQQVLRFGVHRYCPGLKYPARRFVPGRAQLHPRKAGTLIEVDATLALKAGLDLFFARYFWEAHEAWEGLWNARGREGPAADAVRGLIKIAAAGVKVAQGQPRGVSSHLAGALGYLAPLNAGAADIAPVALAATVNALRPLVERDRAAALRETDVLRLIVAFGAQ